MEQTKQESKHQYKVFTDGAYSSSRDQGGIGILITKDDKIILEYSKMYSKVSNNKMELGAVIVALRLIKNPIDSLIIYTDSEYVRGCAVLGWNRNKNKTLWTEFDKQFERVKQLCPNIEFIHVDGHQNDDSIETKYNNLADKLAVKASQELCSQD